MKNTPFIFRLSVIFLIFSILCAPLSRIPRASLSVEKISAFFKDLILTISNRAERSLFEVLIVAVIALSLSFFVSVLFIDKYKAKRFFLSSLSVLLIAVSLFLVIVFPKRNVSYFDSYEANREELILLLEFFSAEINSFSDPPRQAPSDYEAIIYDSYRELDYPLSLTKTYPKIKATLAPRLATRLRVLAKYSFLTSEIALNESAPEYTHPFSAAHEMAHLFGVFSEGEANLFAYITLTNTKSEYLRYSAYLSAFEYVFSSLSSLDSEREWNIYSSLPDFAKNDIKAYYDFYYSFSSGVSDISDTLNSALSGALSDGENRSYESFAGLLVPIVLHRTSN